MDDIFQPETVNQYIERINKLQPNTEPLWGKMNGAQMLTHCSGAYFEGSKKIGFFWWIVIRFFRKEIVIGHQPYPRGMRTSKSFIPTDTLDFEKERTKLIQGIKRVHDLGPDYFLDKKHPIFGKMTVKQWNIFFTKHLDHHLQQFGV